MPNLTNKQIVRADAPALAMMLCYFGKKKFIHIYCYSWSKVHSSNIFYYLKIANLIHLLYWKSNIHSLVLISCYKQTSRICPLIVMFLMMPALLRQGKIFYKHLQQDFLKKNHFSKILASLITNVKVCIPKYEQYPSTNVLSTRINGRPIIFARALNQPSKNIPEKEKKKKNEFSHTMARATLSLFTWNT